MHVNQGVKSGSFNKCIDDQAGFMADMTSITFAQLPIENDQVAPSSESQAGQQAFSPREQLNTVTLVKISRTKIEPEDDNRVRAETLACGKFRREKFWPKRYQCTMGILEVLGANTPDVSFFDFPEVKGLGDSIVSEESQVSDKELSLEEKKSENSKKRTQLLLAHSAE